jgi:BRCT domain type II-containing protein
MAPSNSPNRIKGHVYAFTGRIAGWPRERILYPRVERRGGRVAKSIASAECLVHAELLGGLKTTRKLVKARQMNIPIITEEQFLKLLRAKNRETR